MSLRIVNIVSTCRLDKQLDLSAINKLHFNTIYKPHKFTGLIKKFKTSTVLFFPNGKLTITGSKTEKEARKISRKAAKMVKALKVMDFKIQNIVGTVNLKEFIVEKEGTVIDLKKLYEITTNSIYEPERYSALILPINEMKVMIFHNGKINFTAAKTIDQINDTYAEILMLLEYNNSIQLK